ncbi:uncharacterized protein TNCV_4029361 [Trichonephila clavipes]|nr:uncharacterized protein TNCV_4029361 [Trichonephila clavipes]
MYSVFPAGGTLNSRHAASPLMWLGEVEERWEAPVHPQSFLPLNWGGTKQNRTVSCMVLKAKANDRLVGNFFENVKKNLEMAFRNYSLDSFMWQTLRRRDKDLQHSDDAAESKSRSQCDTTTVG